VAESTTPDAAAVAAIVTDPSVKFVGEKFVTALATSVPSGLVTAMPPPVSRDNRVPSK
jgi:hypothetical protein